MSVIATDRVDRTLARVAELPLLEILKKFDLTLSASSRDGRNWVVGINGQEMVEFKDGPDSSVAGSVSGSGRSTDLALVDLCAAISGKLMVLDGLGAGRKEIQLPNKVTVE